jgi:hypothetical protein
MRLKLLLQGALLRLFIPDFWVKFPPINHPGQWTAQVFIHTRSGTYELVNYIQVNGFQAAYLKARRMALKLQRVTRDVGITWAINKGE